MHAVSTREPQSDPPEVMTIEQVAMYLQLHPQVVYRHVRAGTLPASRIGRTIRFKKSVLDAFLEKGAWEFANQYLMFVNRARTAAVGSAEAVRAPSAAVAVAAAPEPVKQFSADVD